MTDNELKQLQQLQQAYLKEFGPAQTFWMLSHLIENEPNEELHAQVRVYGRLRYAGAFFYNRAAQIKHAALNKKNEP